jgi:hypothetical protein
LSGLPTILEIKFPSASSDSIRRAVAAAATVNEFDRFLQLEDAIKSAATLDEFLVQLR